MAWNIHADIEAFSTGKQNKHVEHCWLWEVWEFWRISCRDFRTFSEHFFSYPDKKQKGPRCFGKTYENQLLEFDVQNGLETKKLSWNVTKMLLNLYSMDWNGH